jgi:FKBP-type peptidyl-prolyl cis-trans isomerase (trigger factor)
MAALAMKEIIGQEEVKVDSKEVEAEMNKTLQYYKNVKNLEKNLDMEKLYSHAKGVLENEKILEFLGKL